MHALILAGGFATRLWPLTEKRAKPLLPVAGKPIMEYLVEKIPTEIPITVTTNAAFREDFEAWLKTMERPNVTLLIEDTTKDDHKLGALGATRDWIERKQIKDDILLLTGDNYLGFSLTDFLNAFRPGTPLLAAFDIGDRAKASAFGTVIVDASDPRHITGFEEKPIEPKSTLVSSGCCIIPREHVTTLIEYAKEKPDNVGGIFEEFLRRNITVDCFTFTEPWLDIGSFPAYLDAHHLLLDRQAHVEPSAALRQTVTEGTIYVGHGTVVNDSHLTDCVIFDDCIIKDCILRSCVIDRGCRLQGVDLTGKMIREGTVLER